MNSVSSEFILQGDREEDLSLQKKQHDQIEDILNAVGGMIQGADTTLTNLEENVDLLPSAILRKCQELADGIGMLASRLEEHSPEQQRELAQACVRDFHHSLVLEENGILCQQRNLTVSPPSEDDFLKAIQGVSTVLRDVEAAFREISETDAEDIADAALTLARLFLLSLQNVHETLTPDDFLMHKNDVDVERSEVIIEELHEDQENLSDDADTSRSAKDFLKFSSTTKRPVRRVRILWPRLGPAVTDALQWGKEAAGERPLLMVALGLTLWPAVIVTSLVGGSLVLADHVVQDVYQHFQDGPLVSNLEQGAAQLLQVGKLGLVLTSVVGKQTWRVVQRQVKRHGGVESIAHSVKDLALDRIAHPIETVGMAWNGISWGIVTASDTIQQILQQREEMMAAQELQ